MPFVVAQSTHGCDRLRGRWLALAASVAILTTVPQTTVVSQDAPIALWTPFHSGLSVSAGSPGSYFGQDFHTGASYWAIDLNRTDTFDDGSEALAAAAGVVSSIGTVNCLTGVSAGWGVRVQHGSYETFYLHLKTDPRMDPGIRVGQNVNIGETIGIVGFYGNACASGPHLHFALYGSDGNSIRPSPFRQNQQINSNPTILTGYHHAMQASAQARWHPNGSILKVAGDATLWLLDGGTRRGVPSLDVLKGQRLNRYKAVTVSSEELNQIPVGATLQAPPATRLKKGSSSAIYLITDRGYRRLFASVAVMTGLGYSLADVSTVSDGELSSHPDDPAVPTLFSPFSDGTLISSNGTVYVITDGKRRGISTESAFTSLGYYWDDAVAVSQAVVDTIPEGPPITDATVAGSGSPAPGAFGKAMPANGATGAPLFLSLGWLPSAGATSYDYCYDTTNDNACSGSWTPAGTNTVAAIAGLLPGVTYFWQVRAHNASGTVEANSAAWWTFATAAGQPGPFGKTSPANGTTNLGTVPSLSWDASDGATSYEYCYDGSNDGACGHWIDAGTSRFVSIQGQLQPRTTYYWQVRARNAHGTVQANNAGWWTFSTRPAIGTYFFDDLEGGAPGWSAQSPWQTTTEFPHGWGHAWSDSPHTRYAPNTNPSLVSPPIVLTAAGRPRLRFWQRRELGAGDAATVSVTTNDGLSYTLLKSFVGSTSGWNQSFVDLSAFAGSASIRIRFQLLADGASEGDGWIIDDVFVERAAAIEDFDGDGSSDILLQHAGSSWIGAWRMNSAGLPDTFLPIAFGDTQGWKPVGTGDFNRDAINDIVLQHSSSWVGVWFLNAAHQPAVFHYVAPYDLGDWKVVGTTDLDNNGITDLLLQHPIEGVAAWRLGEFAQPFAYNTIVRTPMNGWSVVATADITGDGFTDVILQHSSSWVGAWRMGETGWPGSFVPIAFGDTAGWRVVGAADVDRDGAPDLLLQHPTQGVGAWRLNAAGQLLGFHPIAMGDLGGWKVNGRN